VASGSKIEWTDETWNPVTGCTKVSPGCDHCYAESFAHRFAGTPAYPNGFAVTLRPERLGQPLHWRRPRKVFVNSMADLFHADIPADYIGQIFAVMASSAAHQFQILTKRHARMRALLASRDFHDLVIDKWGDLFVQGPSRAQLVPAQHWPLPNVWLGTSIESDKYVWRADALRETPAAVRFLSCEPLLGPLPSLDLTGIDWVIAGGESGPRHRQMDPDWVRDLRDRCVMAGVAFFFKQYAGRSPKAGGRELDGHIWDQYPEPITPAQIQLPDLDPERPSGPAIATRRYGA